MLRQRYQIREALTSRSDVRTWRAHDTTTDRDVFVKELVLEYVESWKAVELFEREIKALRQLDHAMVPDLVETWTDVEDEIATFGVVRHWVDGAPLADQFGGEERARIDEAKVRRILASVGELLAYLHAFRPPVVHRDITPSHIIETEGGDFVVVGFGGVQAALPKTRGGSTFVGTSGYIPPEQLMGSASPASDVYALGVTCAALCSGFPADELAVVDMRIQYADHVDLSPALRRLLDDMTSPSAERRPPDGAALLRRLERLDTELTRAETALIDHPPPSSLATRTRRGQLRVTMRSPLTRGNLGRTMVAAAIVVTTMILALLAGLSSQIGFFFELMGTGVMIAMSIIVSAFVVALFAALPASLLAPRVSIDDDRVWTRFRTRLLGWNLRELNGVQIVSTSGGHDVAIDCEGELRPIAQQLSQNEAEWLRDRIRDRMFHD